VGEGDEKAGGIAERMKEEGRKVKKKRLYMRGRETGGEKGNWEGQEVPKARNIGKQRMPQQQQQQQQKVRKKEREQAGFLLPDEQAEGQGKLE
jgi:hypothetical protein